LKAFFAAGGLTGALPLDPDGNFRPQEDPIIYGILVFQVLAIYGPENGDRNYGHDTIWFSL